MGLPPAARPARAAGRGVGSVRDACRDVRHARQLSSRYRRACSPIPRRETSIHFTRRPRRLSGANPARRSAHSAHPWGMGVARRSAQSVHPSGGGRVAAVRTVRTPFEGWARRGGPHNPHPLRGRARRIIGEQIPGRTPCRTARRRAAFPFRDIRDGRRSVPATRFAMREQPAALVRGAADQQ